MYVDLGRKVKDVYRVRWPWHYAYAALAALLLFCQLAGCTATVFPRLRSRSRILIPAIPYWDAIRIRFSARLPPLRPRGRFH